MFEYTNDTFRVTLYTFSFLLFLTYFIILKCRRDPRLKRFSKTLPGPPGLPLLGNTLPFVFGGLGGVNRHLHQYTQTYGSIFRIWLGNELVLGLSNVEYLEIFISWMVEGCWMVLSANTPFVTVIKTVFRSTKTLSRPTILFDGYRETFGSSLFTAPVPVWRQTRKRLQPIFAKNVIKSQLPLFHEYIEKSTDEVKKHINGAEFNVRDYMHEMAIDLFLGVYYNVHLTSKEKEHLRFREILISSSTYAFSKMIYPWLRSKYISKLYLADQKEKFEKKLRDHFSLLKFTEPDRTLKTRNENETPTKSLLSSLQKLEEDMKIEDYAFHESSNFIIALMGATATTISSCLLAIAMHPDIQSKLCDELTKVIGDDDRPAYQYDLSKFEYLDKVVKETQRRFTIIKDIFREVEDDIEIGSMTVPKRVVIMIRIVEVHMNPDLYSNPEDFNPENFSAEATRSRSKYSYLPHSSGIRNCIGKHLAENIVKLTVINFLRIFKLSTSVQMKDIDYTGAVSTRKPKGFWIRIEPRSLREVIRSEI